MAASLSPGVLHLYPGQKVLVFIVNGHLKAWAIAWGGPSEEQPPGPGEPFGAGPTNPGRYVIWRIAPYRTPTWKSSRIRWGTRLKLDPHNPDDVLYETDSGRWDSVLKKTSNSWSRTDIMDRYHELYGIREVPKTWVLNDFGSMAVRYFKDRNHNGKLDPDEHLEGEMFHSTAENEAETLRNPAKVKMEYSHGCIHLKPAQRDKLINRGILVRGRILIIHKYDEKYVRKPADPTAAESML
jgi:hypothetical protein